MSYFVTVIEILMHCFRTTIVTISLFYLRLHLDFQPETILLLHEGNIDKTHVILCTILPNL